jgi:hypothetical protein
MNSLQNSPLRPNQSPKDVSTTTPEEEAIRLMGRFFGKLSQEVRDTIYEYVLGFNQPMARVGEGISHWKDVDMTIWTRTTPGPPRIVTREPLQTIDTSILKVNKAIHTDVLKTIYRTKTISLNRLQCFLIFKRKEMEQPEAFSGDVGLAKHLLLQRHWSDVRINEFRDQNTINLESFFTRIRHHFPHLRSVTVLTDGTARPITSLFEIGIDMMNCAQVTRVTFDAVGSLVAETTFGFTVRVQCRLIFKVWQRKMAKPLVPLQYRISRMDCVAQAKKMIDAREANTLRKRYRNDAQQLKEIIKQERFRVFRKRIPRPYRACGFRSNEFWTWAAANMRGYSKFLAGSSVFDSETEDTSEVEDDPRLPPRPAPRKKSRRRKGGNRW